MSWNTIVGQNAVIEMLQRSILSNRIPHALLLSGPQGVGKVAVAIAFAQTVNCASPIVTSNSIDACGYCGPCIRSHKLHHSNIQIVLASPTPKTGAADSAAAEEVIDEMAEVYNSLAADPYLPVRIEQATQIRIGQIRLLKKSLALSAAEDGRRVIIVIDAEDMTNEASNAFLKTLEEPHDEVTIIMCTSRRERLLPTIISRCQELVCSPIHDDLIAKHLVATDRCTETEARLIASFSEGSISTAYSFVTDDMAERREQAVDLLRQSLKGRGHRSAIVECVQQTCDAKDRKGASILLSLMALWLRDAAILRSAAETRIVNADQADALAKFVSAFPLADYSACLQSLERAAKDLHRNVSVHLVFITTLLQIRSAVTSPKRHLQTT